MIYNTLSVCITDPPTINLYLSHYDFLIDLYALCVFYFINVLVIFCFQSLKLYIDKIYSYTIVQLLYSYCTVIVQLLSYSPLSSYFIHRILDLKLILLLL